MVDAKDIANDPNTVALSDTVDQTSKAVIQILPPDKVKKMRARFVEKNGVKPTEDEDVAKEQLSALFVAVTIMMSVYADFALWVPFWKRMLKKKRFMGRVPDEHGELQTVEILGPASFDAWETCYSLMLDIRWCAEELCITYQIVRQTVSGVLGSDIPG